MRGDTLPNPTNYLLTNYGVQALIDITPFGNQSTLVPFGNGFNNITEALNEVVNQYFFLSRGGYADNFVTGMAPAYTFTGVRIIGDPAQDYVFNTARKFGLMAERNTNFVLSRANADGTIDQINCPVTLCNLTDIGGGTTDGSAVSVEIRPNGKPVITTITPGATVTVQSAAGTVQGDTALTVTPALPPAGCKYVYAYGSVAPTAAVGSVLTGWNDYPGNGQFTIPNGAYVVVAAVNMSTSVVVAQGQATVVANAGG